jgi:hypothetical protein
LSASTDHKERLLADPAFFLDYYFADKLEGLKDFHLRLIDNASSKAKSLILYPAGHGKTTLVSTLLPIWAVCKNPNIRIAIIGKNESEAKDKIARVIMAELMGNDTLIRDFGPFVPSSDNKSWSLTSLTVEKRTIRAKEPTIAFFGSGSKGTLGHRADWVICDDVVTEKNSATPEQRGSMREWFNQSVQTMNLPGGRLTVIGTLFDPEDLYNDLFHLIDPEHGKPIYHVQHEDAIVDEENHVTLWQEWWPWVRLMEQKAIMGTLDFNKRYRNIAVDASRQVFREEYVKGGYIGKVHYPGCLDRQYSIGDYADDWPVYCGFDPARGKTRHAKFCVHMTIAMGRCAKHPDGCIWIVDMERDQMTIQQQADLVMHQHMEYNAFTSRVEANSFQEGLIDVIKERMDEAGKQLRVEPHLTTRVNKVDPEVGVARMAPWFENAKVHIPQGNPESLRKMQQLVDELIEYPGRTTDCVMALWFAWMAAMESTNTMRSVNRLQAKPNKFWGQRAVGRRVVKNPFYVTKETADEVA